MQMTPPVRRDPDARQRASFVIENNEPRVSWLGILYFCIHHGLFFFGLFSLCCGQSYCCQAWHACLTWWCAARPFLFLRPLWVIVNIIMQYIHNTLCLLSDGALILSVSRLGRHCGQLLSLSFFAPSANCVCVCVCVRSLNVSVCVCCATRYLAKPKRRAINNNCTLKILVGYGL